jgi:hypothetical protein
MRTSSSPKRGTDGCVTGSAAGQAEVFFEESAVQAVEPLGEGVIWSRQDLEPPGEAEPATPEQTAKIMLHRGSRGFHYTVTAKYWVERVAGLVLAAGAGLPG